MKENLSVDLAIANLRGLSNAKVCNVLSEIKIKKVEADRPREVLKDRFVVEVRAEILDSSADFMIIFHKDLISSSKKRFAIVEIVE